MAFMFGSRVKKAWSAFWNARDPTPTTYDHTSWTRPDRAIYSSGVERSIIASIFNRIATDVSASDIRHVKLDKDNRFKEYVKDGIDNCLTAEANVDQTGRALVHDIVSSMLDEGCVAVAITFADEDPNLTEAYDILELRVGKIVEWASYDVRVDIYNEQKGVHEQIWVPKKRTAIIENPFYSVMNQPNSTMQRLVRKLNLLDRIDNIIGSNKFDLIIQLPYLTHTQAKKRQAAERRAEIENQLNNAQLGVAYIDATEKVIQLNRPLENTLLGQIKYLREQVLAELGLDETVLNGTADEKTMTNYNNRLIVPILLAITEEMNRKFLSKTARTQKHQIKYFNDPFRLLPVSQVPEFADKLTRNEIMTSNEIRGILGIPPSSDPSADELRNKNLNQSKNGGAEDATQSKINSILRQMDSEESQMNNDM